MSILTPKDHWNHRYANIYKGHDGESWLREHATLIPPGQGLRALDLGCGQGEASIYLNSLGYDVTACDLSSIATDRLRGGVPGLRAICLNMLDGLPFENNAFDLVVASLSTHYFPWRDTEALYRDIHRVMATGGSLFIRVNSEKERLMGDRENPIEEIEPGLYRTNSGMTKRYFTRDCLRALLAAFQIQSIRDVEFSYHGRTKYAIEAVVQR